ASPRACRGARTGANPSPPSPPNPLSHGGERGDLTKTGSAVLSSILVPPLPSWERGLGGEGGPTATTTRRPLSSRRRGSGPNSPGARPGTRPATSPAATRYTAASPSPGTHADRATCDRSPRIASIIREHDAPGPASMNTCTPSA